VRLLDPAATRQRRLYEISSFAEKIKSLPASEFDYAVLNFIKREYSPTEKVAKDYLEAVRKRIGVSAQ
jgi:hypothetical protein